MRGNRMVVVLCGYASGLAMARFAAIQLAQRQEAFRIEVDKFTLPTAHIKGKRKAQWKSERAGRS